METIQESSVACEALSLARFWEGAVGRTRRISGPAREPSPSRTATQWWCLKCTPSTPLRYDDEARYASVMTLTHCCCYVDVTFLRPRELRQRVRLRLVEMR